MGKALVLGAGRMGSVIAYAMDKLGHDVTTVDKLAGIPDGIKKIGLENTYKSCANLKADINGISSGMDVVISALPYHQNEDIAKSCIDSQIPYCDLGGRLDVSKNINDYADESDFPWVFTDLGLAPGLVNILAEWGYHELGGADSIKMMVGGLPALVHVNPLRYSVTWSIDGLINEYRDDCEILQDGKIKVVKGMTGLEPIRTRAHEPRNLPAAWLHYPPRSLEAFYTSGGAAHTIRTMHERGVSNCAYKTLRYPGHRDIVQFLIRDCELSDDCLTEIFSKGCCDLGKDIVIVICSVSKGDLEWKKEFVIKSHEFSAMQKATAFSLAAVASTVANGLSNPTRFVSGSHMMYKDVDFSQFNDNMNKLGVTI